MDQILGDSALINFERLNMIKGLRSENGQPLARELLEHAQSDGLSILKAFLHAAETDDRALATRHAHKLKGMAANLGLSRTHLAFKELERRARTSEETIVSVPEIEKIHKLYSESLEAYRYYAIE